LRAIMNQAFRLVERILESVLVVNTQRDLRPHGEAEAVYETCFSVTRTLSDLVLLEERSLSQSTLRCHAAVYDDRICISTHDTGYNAMSIRRSAISTLNSRASNCQ